MQVKVAGSEVVVWRKGMNNASQSILELMWRMWSALHSDSAKPS